MTGQQTSFEIQNQSEKMASVASTSASMDLTAVVPALMEGIAQEVGVEVSELKVILVGDETQIDVKPVQTLKDSLRAVSPSRVAVPEDHPAGLSGDTEDGTSPGNST